MESVYEQFNVDVRYGVNLEPLNSGTPCLYATSHTLNQGEHVWGIEVSERASLLGKIEALRDGMASFVGANMDYERVE